MRHDWVGFSTSPRAWPLWARRVFVIGMPITGPLLVVYAVGLVVFGWAFVLFVRLVVWAAWLWEASPKKPVDPFNPANHAVGCEARSTLNIADCRCSIPGHRGMTFSDFAFWSSVATAALYAFSVVMLVLAIRNLR